MNNKAFYWEIKDIVTQFVAAFDDAIIARFNKDRQEQEKISVRYVFAPKQRVMYDIVNKAQNLTLPAVAFNITSISRDQSRVFSKIENQYLPLADKTYGERSLKIPMPIPVNIEVSMSILTKYMNDMDQIISNFVPYSNPYIILSWQYPESFGLQDKNEIRSEVLWSGNLAYNTPTDIGYSDKFRAVVDTSFTIKSWLFKEVKDVVDIIYKIDANFYASKFNSYVYDPSEYLYENTTELDRNTTDTVTVSGLPSITNLFYASTGTTISVQEPVSIRRNNSNMFIVYGRMLNRNNTVYLSSSTLDFFKNFEEIKTAKSPTISGYNITEYCSVLNNNIFTVNLPANTLSTTGKFTIVTSNSAGWAATNDGYAVGVD